MIPLKIKDSVIGVISINKLLVQKTAFTTMDYELFTLLAGHAATAIFSAKLYSASARKLTTLQGFLDMMKQPGHESARSAASAPRARLLARSESQASSPVAAIMERRVIPWATTLGELKRTGGRRLARREGRDAPEPAAQARARASRSFPGILGYDESVVPQVVNAVLSRHNMILLGLRGQAKSRLLRSLTTPARSAIPCVAGSEIHDDPVPADQPQCSRDLIAERGDETPIAWLTPDGTLRREAGHPRRDDRRHHRRRGPDPRRPRRPRPGAAS